MEYLYIEKITRDFMANFNILDFHFYSEFTGYMKIQVEEKIFEYDFLLQDTKDLIEKLIDRKTKEEFEHKIIFDKLNSILPEHKKNEKIYSTLKEARFNEYLMYEVETAISKGVAKKLGKKTQIKFIEYKKIDKVFDIYCDFLIFERKFRIHFIKHNGYFTVNIAGRDLSMDNWFSKEISKNTINKEQSLFYVNTEVYHYFYSIVNLFGGLIIQKFKDTKFYKMATLYDNELKDLFE
jgi:hypothetical protein